MLVFVKFLSGFVVNYYHGVLIIETIFLKKKTFVVITMIKNLLEDQTKTQQNLHCAAVAGQIGLEMVGVNGLK